MTTTVDFIYYHLKVSAIDADPVWFEAEQNGAKLEFNRFKEPVIVMPETNPYNSFFSVKFADVIREVTKDRWYL